MPYSTLTISCQVGRESPGGFYVDNQYFITVGESHLGIRIPIVGVEKGLFVLGRITSALDILFSGASFPAPRFFAFTLATVDPASPPAPFSDSNLPSAQPTLAQFNRGFLVQNPGSAAPGEDTSVAFPEALIADIEARIQWVTHHPLWTPGDAVGIILSNPSFGPVDLSSFMEFGNLSLGQWDSLALQYAVLNEPSSIANRQQGSRWFLCPRCGNEEPASAAVLDGEVPRMVVCRDCRDEPGRRDSRAPRERSDRLWPRL